MTVRQPTWLVDLFSIPIAGGNAPYGLLGLWFTGGEVLDAHFSLYDLDVAGTFFSGRIIGEPRIERSFAEVFFGIIRVNTITLVLSNVDGGLTSIYNADPRRRRITMRLHDVSTGVSTVEFTGLITQATLEPGTLTLTASSPDLSIFEQPLPRGTIDAATFSDTARDMGATIPVVFGNVDRRRLPCIKDDTLNDIYDYLVSRGSVSVPTVYRDGPNGALHIVNPSEYTVSTTQYPGFTTIRFALRQISFQGGFHLLFADVIGLQPERNFARAIRSLLSDSTYGLGQPVDSAAFAQAESDLDVIGDLFCDGALSSRRQAQDVLNDLMVVRGIRLDINAAGEWSPIVDTEVLTSSLHLQDGEDDGPRNILAVRGGLSRPVVTNAVSTLRLRFREDDEVPSQLSRTRLEITRTVHTFGQERPIDHPFIRDTTTADKVADYLAKRLKYAEEGLSVDVTYDAQALKPHDLVTITYAALGLSARQMEVESCEKRLDSFTLVLTGWSSDIYTYTPGPLPVDASGPVLVDFAREAPATPTGLTASPGSATTQADGMTIAFADISWNANTESDLAGYELQFRRTVDLFWTTRSIGRDTTSVREIMAAGAQYEIRLRALDIFGNPSPFATTPVTLPTDASDPPVPSGVIATGLFLGAVITWVPITDIDLLYVEVWRSEQNDRSTAELIGEAVNTFIDSGLKMLTTYYYWLRSVDFSRNMSDFHAGDNMGTPVTTTGSVGFKLTLATTVFVGTFVNDVMAAAMTFDSVESEINWLVRVDTDIYYGEITQNGSPHNALGLKWAGETRVAAAFDGANIQALLINAGVVEYAKLSRTGVSLVTPVAKFTPAASHVYARAALACQAENPSEVYCALMYEDEPFSVAKARLARVDLNGTQTLAPTDIAGTDGAFISDEIRIAVDREGNAHILFKFQSSTAFQEDAFQADAFQSDSPQPMRYVKVNSTGSVLIAPTALFTPPPGTNDVAPAAILIDANDVLHVLGYTYIGTGIMYSYGRMTKDGVVITPLTLFFSTPTDVKLGIGSIDRQLNQIYLGWLNTISVNQLRLDPVDPTGLSLDANLPVTSL